MELRRRVRFVPLSGAPSLLSVLSCVVLVGTQLLEAFIKPPIDCAQVERQSVKLVGGLIESGA